MKIRTQITLAARARGWTAAELARRLGGYRSNISAMDAGRRSISTRTLARIAQMLDCSPTDLIDIGLTKEAAVFPSRRLQAQLTERDLGTPDGTEKGWVHELYLTWRRHYQGSQRAA